MEKYTEILKNCALFYSLTEEQISTVLKDLNITVKDYKKNEYVYHQGQEIENIGIILCGNAQIISTDYFGNDSIYSVISDGDMFGEALFAIQNRKMPFSIVSTRESKILFIRKSQLFSDKIKTDENDIIIKNLIYILAEKTLKFRQTIEHVTRRTTRQKVLSYLSHMANTANSETFSIPFNRQQLADYLAVERSALSAELSRMKQDGLLEYKKNVFTIKHK